MSQWQEAKKTVLAAARKMSEKGLVIGTSGNISLRLPPVGKRQLLAITPTSRHYDLLDVGDIPIIDFDGKRVEGDLPSSVETPLHIGIYRARNNINAIIHTHSVFASAVAVATAVLVIYIPRLLLVIRVNLFKLSFPNSASALLIKNVFWHNVLILLYQAAPVCRQLYLLCSRTCSWDESSGKRPAATSNHNHYPAGVA
jgi:L-fuculose-phosphate aldolase